MVFCVITFFVLYSHIFFFYLKVCVLVRCVRFPGDQLLRGSWAQRGGAERSWTEPGGVQGHV